MDRPDDDGAWWAVKRIASPNATHTMQLRLDPEHRLLAGVLVASLSGLLLGAAMHPTLQGADENGGPRMLIAGGGPRGDAASGSDASWSNYPGRLPDYVVGTDWLRARAEPALTVASIYDIAPDLPDESQDTVEQHPVAYATAERDNEQPARPLYPSIDGNRAYPSDAHTSDEGDPEAEDDEPAP